MAPIRVVHAGCGGISKAWLRIAVDDPDIELVGLVDLRPDAIEKRAAEFGLERLPTGTDLAAVLADLKPDAVFDTTVPEAHEAVTVTALRAGCHVLGEKPMAATMDQARRMVDAAARADRIYAVTQTRRPQPGVAAIADLIARGEIGRLEEIHCAFFRGPKFGGFRDEMRHPLILDMAVHHFDMARAMSGADPRSALAHAWTPPRSWMKGESSAAAIFEMTGDAVFTYQGSWVAPSARTAWEGEWRLIGSAGAITWDGYDRITRFDALDPADTTWDAEVASRPVPLPEMPTRGHQHLISEFADVLLGKTERCSCPADDNIKSLAMVHAAVESAAAGARVAIRD